MEILFWKFPPGQKTFNYSGPPKQLVRTRIRKKLDIIQAQLINQVLTLLDECAKGPLKQSKDSLYIHWENRQHKFRVRIGATRSLVSSKCAPLSGREPCRTAISNMSHPSYCGWTKNPAETLASFPCIYQQTMVSYVSTWRMILLIHPISQPATQCCGQGGCEP